MGSQLAIRAQIALACLAIATSAHADPKQEARDHLAASAKLFGDGKYADALAELQAAYALDPQPGLLYSIGQVQLKLGDCELAIGSYKQFLATKPDPKPKQAAEEAIAACQREIDARPNPVEPPPPPPPKPEPPPPPPPKAEPPPSPPPPPPNDQPAASSGSSWYGDVVLDGLAIGGVAGLAIGGLYYSKAHSDYDSAERAMDYTAHHSLIDSGKRAQTISIVASAAGGALVVGAVVRYFVSDRGSEPASTVGVTPTAAGGAAVTWSGQW